MAKRAGSINLFRHRAAGCGRAGDGLLRLGGRGRGALPLSLTPLSASRPSGPWPACWLLFLLSHVDYSLYKSPRFIYTSLSVTTFLLVLVFFMPGSHHTHRWIRFGNFFTFEPSEIAKPVLVLFLAWFLSTRLDQMRDWKNTLLRAALIPLVFVVLDRPPARPGHRAGAGRRHRHDALSGWHGVEVPVAGVCATLPVLAALLFWVSWRRAAHAGLPHPDSRPAGRGFHINQSLIAVGTGGMTGRGYMEGVQKLFFLPEAHTDFIFANIAEELGLIGAIAIRAALRGLRLRGLRVAFRSQDPFARLAAFGITTTIVLQAFFNISVVLSLLPTKGIPLPADLSIGGWNISSALFCRPGLLASIGTGVYCSTLSEKNCRSKARADSPTCLSREAGLTCCFQNRLK
jgi:cell division protein FtsW